MFICRIRFLMSLRENSPLAGVCFLTCTSNKSNKINLNFIINKNMTTRTCPHCGYKYSRIEYVKRLSFKTIWSKWDCPKCEQKITFDNMRRLLLALILGVDVFFLSITSNYISLNFIGVVLYLAALFLGTMFIFTFDKFIKTSKLG